MSHALRTPPLPRIFPTDSTIVWKLDGHTYRGRIVRHDDSGGRSFITIAWDDGGSGRFIEAELPPGMSVGAPVSATERTQPMPAIRRRP